MIELPKGVHRVVSRGREYFYWHPGRGTKEAGRRVPLPKDPHDPKFWAVLREAQGIATVKETTLGMVIDLYLSSPKFTKLSPGSQGAYQRDLGIARVGWENTPADQMRPSLIRGVVEGLADKPAAANSFLRTMRALSTWGLVRDYFNVSLTDGVEPHASDGGHKPWTDEQIAAVHRLPHGVARQAIILGLYTGQRGSDVVRMSWTDIDEGGFRITQRKTKREIWCPIVPELAAEMESWAKAPGPFLKQPKGRRAGYPYSKRQFLREFEKARQSAPELAGVTFHGLRATAVIRLRRAGLSTAQIEDIVGMSMAMITRYCRFADKKASGKAAVVRLTEHRRNAKL